MKKQNLNIKDAIDKSPEEDLTDTLSEESKDKALDRELKEYYAKILITILIGQLVVMNIVFILTGIGLLKFSKWILELYMGGMGGTLAEVFGVILVITQHHFPIRKT